MSSNTNFKTNQTYLEAINENAEWVKNYLLSIGKDSIKEVKVNKEKVKKTKLTKEKRVFSEMQGLYT